MNWVWSNLDRIGELVVVHLALSVPPVILAFVISVPIGWAAWRFRWSRGLLLSVCGILYAIPSLPLLLTLPGLVGVPLRSPANMILALALYGVALMVRTAADAFGDVDGDVRLASTAMGFSAWRRFTGVELPLAGPGLLAGLRVVIVSTVSLATISAVIGVQSLGSLFTDGFQRNIPAEIWSGVIATMLIAVALDALAVLGGRLLMPWARAPRRRRRGIVEQELAEVGA
ncbi:ABC transporter permease subunit [Agromyces sp. CFH 90414]|uniref:ABC transporter permease subunit n=1 Tax=Agromyces agglutinans TaxID=2662258 RepID=A0A6I2FFS9_9MICO|nr:ABC transporter permease subunit [Agromyces agglutinans]MRG61540.1 ABC transporter permease subunit [Agromyces agglutinans]